MKFGRTLVAIGIGLVILAWVSAAGIPKAAHKDFDHLVRSVGGRMSHTPNFPDAFKQMSANRRILQNFYVGASGLICLTIGLANLKRDVERIAPPAEQ